MSTANIDRIRKLLALAADQSSPHEADVARAMAERLMAAAGITADAIEAGAGPADDASSVGRSVDPCADSGRDVAYVTGARAVAAVLDVVTYTTDGKRIWVGTAGQRQAAIEMFAWIRRQIEALARGPAAAGRDGTWLLSYRYGVAESLAAQALRLRAERPAPTSTALARVDAVKAAIKRACPALGKSRARGVALDPGAVGAGRADGAGVTFRAGVSGSARRQLA